MRIALQLLSSLNTDYRDLQDPFLETSTMQSSDTSHVKFESTPVSWGLNQHSKVSGRTSSYGKHSMVAVPDSRCSWQMEVQCCRLTYMDILSQLAKSQARGAWCYKGHLAADLRIGTFNPGLHKPHRQQSQERLQWDSQSLQAHTASATSRRTNS